MISVECAEGKYRSSSMTKCESCSLGKEPNDTKNDCGKYSFKIFVTCILIFKFFRLDWDCSYKCNMDNNCLLF